MSHRLHWLPLILCLCLICLLGRGEQARAAANAAVRFVAPSGTDSGTCLDRGAPCRTLQYAVDQSAAGDEIRLAAGEYATAAPPVADLHTALTLRGGFSTVNWEIADPVTNPTRLSTTCPWDGYDGAVQAGALEPVTIQDLDLNGCGIRSTGELRVERATLTNGWIRHNAPGSQPVVLSGVVITGGGFSHAAGTGSLATLSYVTIRSSQANGIDEISRGNLQLDYAEIQSCAGWGIKFANGSSPSTVAHTVIEQSGGGIEHSGSGVVTLTGVSILNNQGRGVSHQGTGLVMSQVLIAGNHAVVDAPNGDLGDGAGLRNLGKQLTLTGVTIRGNHAAGRGGGIYHAGSSLQMSRVVIGDNQAVGSGGGIWASGRLTVTASSLAGNQATDGGGMLCNGCQADLINVALTANSAPAPAAGSGLYLQGAQVNVLNTSLVGNQGRGLHAAMGGQDALTLRNTLLAGNTGGNCQVSGVPVATYNLSSDATCAFTGAGNQVSTDPLLGRLRLDGFYELQPGSPAVDRAENATCPSVDYRGFYRPLDGDRDGIAVCDIGPLEVGDAYNLPLLIR
jgi:hypothetical protein